MFFELLAVSVKLNPAELRCVLEVSLGLTFTAPTSSPLISFCDLEDMFSVFS